MAAAAVAAIVANTSTTATVAIASFLGDTPLYAKAALPRGHDIAFGRRRVCFIDR